MIPLEDTVRIDRPPHEVFKFVADLNNIQKWDLEVISFRLVTDGPTKVGSQFIEKTKIGTVNCEVIEFLPDRVIAFNGTSPSINIAQRILVEPSEEGTRVTLTGLVEPKGMWKLLQPFMAGEFRNSARKELAALKAILEKQ